MTYSTYKLTNWTNRAGKDLLISEMTSDHIQKCIWMLTPKNNSGHFTNSICGLLLELANRELDESNKVLKILEIIKLKSFFKKNKKLVLVNYIIKIYPHPIILLELENVYGKEDEIIKQIIKNHKNFKNEVSLLLDKMK
jgi:hypothetical protein